LKEEALDPIMWRAGFGRCFGPVVRETSKKNEYYIILYIIVCDILHGTNDHSYRVSD